jgi:hypothetical protein
MANIKSLPGEKRVRMPFTLPEKLKPLLKETAEKLHVSMSRFVEDAIMEKIKRMDGDG